MSVIARFELVLGAEAVLSAVLFIKNNYNVCLVHYDDF